MSFLRNDFPFTRNQDSDLTYIIDLYLTLQSLPDQWTAYQDLINGIVSDLQDFVNNYFDNLDVQNEINNKLDLMASSGELAALLQPYLSILESRISTNENDINTLETRIDSIIAGGTPTDGNTELIDIRTGSDGVLYTTAGSSIRTNFTNMNLYRYPFTVESTLRNLIDVYFPPLILPKIILYGFIPSNQVSLRAVTIGASNTIIAFNYLNSSGVLTTLQTSVPNGTNSFVIYGNGIGVEGEINYSLIQSIAPNGIGVGDSLDAFRLSDSVYNLYYTMQTAIKKSDILVNGEYHVYIRSFIRSNSLSQRTLQIVVTDFGGNEMAIVTYTANNSDIFNPDTIESITLSNSRYVFAVFSVKWSDLKFNISRTNSTAYTVDELDSSVDMNVVMPATVYVNALTESSVYFNNVILDNSRMRKDTYNLFNTIAPTVFSQFEYEFSRKPAATAVDSVSDGYLLYGRWYGLVYKNFIAPFNVISTSANASNGITRNVLVIGDSLTAIGVIMDNTNTLIQNDNFNINFIGTRTTSGGVNHEGRGSWSANTYLTQSEYAGSTNAFWNPNTNAFSFSYYMDTYGFVTPDLVIIALGTNDANLLTGSNVAYDSVIDNFNSIINNIKSFNSNIDIGVWLCPPPNPYFPTAINNNNNMLELHRRIIRGSVNSNYVIPVNINVDVNTGFTNSTIDANSHTSAQIIHADDVHHYNSVGYAQIADSLYSFLKYYTTT